MFHVKKVYASRIRQPRFWGSLFILSGIIFDPPGNWPDRSATSFFIQQRAARFFSEGAPPIRYQAISGKAWVV